MKPHKSEYNPWYQGYIDQVKDDEILLTALEKDGAAFARFLRQIPSEKHGYKYADDKWTIVQMLQHIIDTERIMSYRALTVAREDKTSMPGFDENTYAKAAEGHIENWDNMIHEWLILRQATTLMFKSFDSHALTQIGLANNAPISVNALVHIIIGHVRHHQNILQTRYLN